MTRYATIIGTGRHVPENEMSNAKFAELMGQVNPKLAEVVGKFEASSNIKTRFYAPDDWATSDLAVEAAKDALADAGIGPEDLDLIILGTDSPDYITPATSVVVQHKLGATKAGTFDVGCACASFPTGLNIASGLLATNPHMKYVLVIGAYMMHKLADWQHDVMAFFYGDGAGAAVLTAADKPGFVTSTFFADGSYHKHWGIYSGGTFEPATVESLQAGRTKVRLLQAFPAEVNNEGWPARVRELVANGGFALEDVDMIIFTQVRYNSIELVMADLGLPLSKAHWIMDKWGYTGSACLPMAFDDARKQGRIKSGDLVLFIGSGVGYNQAGAAFVMP
ncbi:MAG: ketoacyl-ACP synthase III [Chloroflexi bacterium]|nr:ketoacyl-ACP synthase III [Chloroflexota bacterium]OQB01328.1 MAG: 3-oxoacyl-(acyl-carrier-protein) synthase 3 [Chloroflexi bacterium ADurb.Bin222]